MEDPGILDEDTRDSLSSSSSGKETESSDIDKGFEADAENISEFGSGSEDGAPPAAATAGTAPNTSGPAANSTKPAATAVAGSDEPNSSDMGSEDGTGDDDDDDPPNGSACDSDQDGQQNNPDGSLRCKLQQQQQHASFLEGGKSASFAKAFAKIMAKPAKAASTAASAAGRGNNAGDVILSESSSLAKHKAEVAAIDAATREAKKQRAELRRRGHLKVPRKGGDPAQDAREKQLQKLATRGVVLLLNAVNKAQKQKKAAEAAGLKGAKAKVNQAGFFAELKAGAKAAAAGVLAAAAGQGLEQLVPGKAVNSAGSLTKQQQHHHRHQQQQQQQLPGWEVLGEGFPGLTGGSKMKDWDKAAALGSNEHLNGQALAGSDDDSGDDEHAW